MKKEKKVGVCIGSSTITMVFHQIDGKRHIVQERHMGNPHAVYMKMVEENKIPESVIVRTGRIKPEEGHYYSEPTVVQRVLNEMKGVVWPEAIISFGGQSIMLYEIDKNGQIINANSFNKCGSGTGEFFLQQIKRLGFSSVEEAILAANEEVSIEKPYVPASRCSVFCKSDTTHACNEKKATPGQISRGLCKMIADKINELITKVNAKNVWIIGGGSQITPVIDFLKSFGLTITIPEEATYFEAYGTSLFASDESRNGKVIREVSVKEISSDEPIVKKSFPTLPPLSNFENLVEWKKITRAEAKEGEKVLLSVDVGSTTTKMTLQSIGDLSIICDYYGYTLGKPNEAVTLGLEEMRKKLKANVVICGIAVTGSGRKLVETFLTDFENKNANGVVVQQAVAINEILCHAKAAEFFNPGVSIVLEIGGQDAKYTYMKNGVLLDFCMNEACSAGTGSFMAEVVKEIFDISDPSHIAPLAILAENPILFGEQCSAFIESDIATSLHEGNGKEDIIAGLCYSICYNYINRVVGNRPINGTISLQGGTAYNKAFCLAMAAVLKMSNILIEGEKIIVSEDAGLMGAIGGAIKLKEMINSNEFISFQTTIDDLLKKELKEGKSFTCNKCDYHCDIKNFIIDGHSVPFGGFCRRYENIRKDNKVIDSNKHDLVKYRDEQLFGVFSNNGESLPAGTKTIGLPGSFFELTYLPFLTNLFVNLGFKPILADKINKDGALKQGASFCWPVEVMHGLFADLIEKNPDFYWLPHFKATSEENMEGESRHCCPFIQGIPYILGTAFKDEVKEEKILKPYLDFSRGITQVINDFLPLQEILGVTEKNLSSAIHDAWEKQKQFFNSIKEKGQETLNWLKEDPSRTAFVLVGRPYNAFSGHLNLNKGIAMKIASMGIPIIPLDFLPYEEEGLENKMYWSAGQMILRGARYIAKHNQLFPVFLTNFSCGPDSFINYKFREYMGYKPSLTLEFDGHTANAGFDTRIEAFIDIVSGYFNSKKQVNTKREFKSAEIISMGKNAFVVDSQGNTIELKDERVHLVFPDMGKYNADAMSDVAVSLGIHSSPLPPADAEVLALGRRHSSCKECVPYNLTLGSILKYVSERENPDEVTVFFMPDTTGPCRFGQYNIFIKGVIEKLKLENVAVITLSSSNAYSGLGSKYALRSWIAICTGMAFLNMSNALKTIAIDPIDAEEYLQNIWTKVRTEIQKGVDLNNFFSFIKLLKKSGKELSMIPLKKTFHDVPKVLVTGEIYARVSKLTTDPLVDYLSENGIATVFESILNWFKYEDEMIKQGFSHGDDYVKLSKTGSFIHRTKMKVEEWTEKRIIKAISSSGLIASHVDNVNDFLNAASPHMSKLLVGETILTTGSALDGVYKDYAGIAVLGPFGCMPSRIAGSILRYTMTAKEKIKLQPNNLKVVTLANKFSKCPIVFIETDGGPLPQITKSQLEVFSLVVEKVNEVMVTF